MTIRTALGKNVAPWRFVMFFVLFGAVGVLASQRVPLARSVLIGFDVAAIAFLVSCAWLFDDKVEDIRKIARQNDANRAILLMLTTILTVVILTAVISELSAAKKLEPLEKGLVAGSLALIWLFANAVYTLHYCHLFYSEDDGGQDCAGLDFPKTDEPVMSDFAYFSYTLGVAVQTSDVEITSCHIRKVVTVHCIVGFFFNIGVLALSINVLGSS